MRVKTLDDEGQKAVAEMIEKGYVLADKPETRIDIPPKEMKLYKQPIQKLIDEREHLRLKFTPRNGGMGGIPLSVRNRIERLEKVIENKVNLINEAIKKNESGSTSEES
tara:strand:+ start:39 stop:365 length:327 start_codon:yes stop_codon:yes gene_type:complete